jgi:hypothetical protein
MTIPLVCNGNREQFDGDLIRLLADNARGWSPKLAARLEDAVAREASLELSDRDAELLLASADAMIMPTGGFEGPLSRLRSFVRPGSRPVVPLPTGR